MILIPFSKSNKFSVTPTCDAREYPNGDKDIWGSVIQIRGRYPDSGFTVNEECKGLVYFIDGNGKVVIDGKEIEVHKSDQLLIDKGEKFFWEGELIMFMPCSPAWYPEQHKQVE